MSTKSALFTNWTEEDFTGYWDGKPKTIKKGQSLWMPEYLARHFAKHLTNRELVRTNANGSFIYPNGETMTSPKFPEQVPAFMDLFNKAFQLDEEEDALGENKKEDIDTIINNTNKNRAKKEAGKKAAPLPNEQKVKPISKLVQDPKEPQTIVPPDFDEDEDDDENFGEAPKEPAEKVTAPKAAKKAKK